ncbi:MAG: SRPBCC family protein, partial [Adhaeribacter sp.]
KPVSEVFEAFVNPEITSKFWFSKGSGRLEVGQRVKWTWEYYNVSGTVLVKSVTPDREIVVQEEDNTTITWEFKALDTAKTFVRIVHSGFTGTPDELIEKVRDSTGGFTIVLAGLKAYLEHGIQLNLVEDKFPEELWNQPAS